MFTFHSSAFIRSEACMWHLDHMISFSMTLGRLLRAFSFSFSITSLHLKCCLIISGLCFFCVVYNKGKGERIMERFIRDRPSMLLWCTPYVNGGVGFWDAHYQKRIKWNPYSYNSNSSAYLDLDIDNLHFANTRGPLDIIDEDSVYSDPSPLPRSVHNRPPTPWSEVSGSDEDSSLEDDMVSHDSWVSVSGDSVVNSLIYPKYLTSFLRLVPNININSQQNETHRQSDHSGTD